MTTQQYAFPTRLFYSYCHKDQRHREAMEKSLALLKQEHLLESWSDQNILPGQRISSTIKEKMDEADIIVFLLSQDFIASDECIKEWKYAKTLADKNELLFRVPIILTKCAWRDMLADDDPKAMPEDGKPVASFADENDPWQQVYTGIKDVINQLRKNLTPNFRDEKRLSDFLEVRINPLTHVQQEKLIRKRPELSDSSKTILSEDWFSKHINKDRAGPRYTPELNVLTEVEEWFAAFGRTTKWIDRLKKLSKDAEKMHNFLCEALMRTEKYGKDLKWPEQFHDEGQSVSETLKDTLDACDSMRNSNEIAVYEKGLNSLENSLSKLASLKDKLIRDLEKRYGEGVGNSPGFRQDMSEILGPLPAKNVALMKAENVDLTKQIFNAFEELRDWLSSPAGRLGFHSAFVLSGAWGVGKTHIIRDVASQRLKHNLLSCVVFGHQFCGEPDFWTRLIQSLGLPTNINKDELLSMLNAAAEASGQPLILFIDAINETRPLQYWQKIFRPIIHEIGRYPHLRICFSCRTAYLDYYRANLDNLPIVEHPGFKGVELIATKAFFERYKLNPPVVPILQPEFGNPFYLWLTCEMLQSCNLDTLPLGWPSIAYMIPAFLDAKEQEFAEEKGIITHPRMVNLCLRSIAQRMAESGTTRLTISEAYRVIQKKQLEGKAFRIIEWLVGENLLIEEAPNTNNESNNDKLNVESTIRLAFERLGDFLVAQELLSQLTDEASLYSVFETGGRWHTLVRDEQAIKENYGILSALSILIPERYHSKELSSFATSDEVHADLVKIAIRSIPWRKPSSFSLSTEALLQKGITKLGLAKDSIDSLLSISWRPSIIDSKWLDNLLRRISLAKRDADWCCYLYQSYEDSSSVKRLIDAAFELPLNTLDSNVADRWVIVLQWFTAAADRRIKDRATRALIKILIAHPEVSLKLLDRFLYLDDDGVRERLLLAIYGALIISQNVDLTAKVADIIQAELHNRPQDFDNALIRDHIRCIYELSAHLKTLCEKSCQQFTVQPIKSEWPLDLPTKDQIDAWRALPHFLPAKIYSDFFFYSMACLNPWKHGFPKADMEKWILQRVARDFGYEESECKNYDQYMLNKYGGGRGKPVWAERIAKKYMWIAMHQLASRLQDHIERKRESGEPESLRIPLILVKGRKFDPTLSIAPAAEEQVGSWWTTASMDVDRDLQLSDEQWIADKKNIPALEEFLKTIQRDDQNWRILTGFQSWNRRKNDVDLHVLYKSVPYEPYRSVLISIEGYLVKEEDFKVAYEHLCYEKPFKKWGQQSATMQYGFAGEYPWATPFNSGQEMHHNFEDNLSATFQPAWSELTIEWGYDVSLQQNHNMLLPARPFFSFSDLWWNGKDGYSLPNGKTVFRDLSVTTEQEILIGDVEDLSQRLDKLGLRFIWTMLGEKIILASPSVQQSPGRRFCQTAYLKKDGTLQVDEREFFVEK